MNKDEIKYFIQRYKFVLIAGLLVAVCAITFTVSAVLKFKENNNVTDDNPIDLDGTAIGLDGTIYENEYVNTNLELQQVIIEGNWTEGQQYNVYFDRVKNEYSVWKVNKTLTGTRLEQVEYKYSLINRPGELQEVPNATLTDMSGLIELDENFYNYYDMTQVYGYLNNKLNDGHNLKYIKIQDNACEAYYSKGNTVYHMLAYNGLLLTSEYTGKLSSGMMDEEPEVKDLSNENN